MSSKKRNPFSLQRALVGSQGLKGLFDFGKTMLFTTMAQKIFDWVDSESGHQAALVNEGGKLQLVFTKDGKPVEGPVEFDKG